MARNFAPVSALVAGGLICSSAMAPWASRAHAGHSESRELTDPQAIRALADPRNEMTGLALPPSHPELSTGLDSDPVGEAVAFYSRGSLRTASTLAWDGRGYLKIFRPRSRQYGTGRLVELIARIGDGLMGRFPTSERLQIGDMSNRDGGEADGHASHQNGLDADIAFLRKNRREQDPQDIAGFAEKFVARGKITANFDVERNFAVIEAFVATGLVNRIFVDQVIKNTLCRYAGSRGWLPAKAEVLRRLRHWPAHDDHMHVRLLCPADDRECIAQEEVPEGSGCAGSSPL